MEDESGMKGLAIDDLGLVDGPCLAPPADQVDCGNGESVPHEAVCNFRLDCSNGHDEKYCGNCNFGEEDSSGSTHKINLTIISFQVLKFAFLKQACVAILLCNAQITHGSYLAPKSIVPKGFARMPHTAPTVISSNWLKLKSRIVINPNRPFSSRQSFVIRLQTASFHFGKYFSLGSN